MDTWKLTVGMEIHVELETETKLFCGCKNDPFATTPNANVCPVCYGLPGALPVINKEAIKMTTRLGRALKGRIASETFWARKNYFYPDLPKGYQISQSTSPLVEDAVVVIDGENHRIERIHLEEDAGKLTHASDNKSSLVNLNRAGVPLMEIVTKPDFHSAADAKRFCQELQRIIRTLKLSSADMEKGKMRCEANISVSKTDELGTKVEVKNINSFRAVEKTIEYEMTRQIEALEIGEKIDQETRTWSEAKGKTVVMRKKETSADYRYFPEPDLPAVRIELEDEESELLPEEKRSRLVEIGLTSELIHPVVDRGMFERIEEISRADKAEAIEAAKLVLAVPAFAEMSLDEQLELLSQKRQNGWTKPITEEVVKISVEKKLPVAEVAKDYQASNDLPELVSAVIAEQAKAVADYKAGKEPLFNFLVGQVMAKAQGRANIATVREELAKQLKD